MSITSVQTPPSFAAVARSALLAQADPNAARLDKAEQRIVTAENLALKVRSAPRGAASIAVAGSSGKVVYRSIDDIRREALGAVAEARASLKGVPSGQRKSGPDAFQYWALIGRADALETYFKPPAPARQATVGGVRQRPVPIARADLKQVSAQLEAALKSNTATDSTLRSLSNDALSLLGSNATVADFSTGNWPLCNVAQPANLSKDDFYNLKSLIEEAVSILYSRLDENIPRNHDQCTTP